MKCLDGPPAGLEGERLVLRPLVADDWEGASGALASDPCCGAVTIRSATAGKSRFSALSTGPVLDAAVAVDKTSGALAGSSQ
ncbi:MAG: hypothetical protein R3E03_03250 [Novosphingobium sp.]